MIYTIPANCNALDLLAKVQDLVGKTAYLSGGETCVSGDYYRYPNERYQKRSAQLRFKAFTSTLKGEFVEREEERSYFELIPALIVRIVIPWKYTDDNPIMKGLGPIWLQPQKITLTLAVASSEAKLPSEFKDDPHCRVERRPRGSKALTYQFLSSDPFWLPDQEFKEWRLNPTAKAEDQALIPPGNWNSQGGYAPNLGVVERDPDRCTVCWGTKGYREMLATWVEGGPNGGWFSNFICAGCCQEAFQQWGRLLKL